MKLSENMKDALAIILPSAALVCLFVFTTPAPAACVMTPNGLVCGTRAPVARVARIVTPQRFQASYYSPSTSDYQGYSSPSISFGASYSTHTPACPDCGRPRTSQSTASVEGRREGRGLFPRLKARRQARRTGSLPRQTRQASQATSYEARYHRAPPESFAPSAGSHDSYGGTVSQAVPSHGSYGGYPASQSTATEETLPASDAVETGESPGDAATYRAPDADDDLTAMTPGDDLVAYVPATADLIAYAPDCFELVAYVPADSSVLLASL